MGSDLPETAVMWILEEDGVVTFQSEPTLPEALESANWILNDGLAKPVAIEHLDQSGRRVVLQGEALVAALVEARKAADQNPAPAPAVLPWIVEVREPNEVLADVGRQGWAARWILVAETATEEDAEEAVQEMLGPIPVERVRISGPRRDGLRTEPPPEAVAVFETPGEICPKCDRFHLGSECHAPGHPSRKGPG